MTPKIDQLAASLERKWGVDRLPKLVSRETAERFGYWRDQMADAQDAEFPDLARLAELEGIVCRGWQALDAEATAAGHQPMPNAWREIDLQTEGRGICAIAEDDEHAQALILRAKAEGRLVEVWTLAEVARVMKVHSIIGAIKREFPEGAYVTTPPAPAGHSGRRKAGMGDDLEDILPLHSAAKDDA